MHWQLSFWLQRFLVCRRKSGQSLKIRLTQAWAKNLVVFSSISHQRRFCPRVYTARTTAVCCQRCECCVSHRIFCWRSARSSDIDKSVASTTLAIISMRNLSWCGEENDWEVFQQNQIFDDIREVRTWAVSNEILIALLISEIWNGVMHLGVCCFHKKCGRCWSWFISNIPLELI